MQSFTLAAVFLTLVLVTSASKEPEYRHGLPVVYNFKNGIDDCPADMFWNDCNRCVCAKDGKQAACTRKGCPPHVVKRSAAALDVPVVYGYKFGEKCPATLFKDDCNSCQCGSDGISAACTLMECAPRDVTISDNKEPEQNKEIPRVSNYAPGTKCPAPEFYSSCNRCSCTKDGINAMCTLMACSDDDGEYVD